MAWQLRHRDNTGGRVMIGIDPAVILALISDLTARLAKAEAENAQLHAALAERQDPTPA